MIVAKVRPVAFSNAYSDCRLRCYRHRHQPARIGVRLIFWYLFAALVP